MHVIIYFMAMSEQELEIRRNNTLVSRRERNGNKNIYRHHPSRHERQMLPVSEDPILTIQIKESTVNRLKRVSHGDNSKTYDDLILYLLQQCSKKRP